MANSIETRAPFLDFRLIEFMVQVDKNVKLQGWERKSILRKTIGTKLPPKLLNAPKKGFGVPLRERPLRGEKPNRNGKLLLREKLLRNERLLRKRPKGEDRKASVFRLIV